MNQTFSKRLLICIISALLSFECFSVNHSLQKIALPDSMQTILNKCSTDTCVFVVISTIINKYGLSDFKSYESYTNLLYNKLKNSSSPYIQYVCHQKMANVHQYNGDFDEAEKEIRIALQIARKNQLADKEYQSIMTLGDLYLGKGNYNEAKTYYLDALSYPVKKHQQRDIYSRIGKLFELSGIYDSAVYYHQLSYEISKEAKNNNLKIQKKLTLANAYIKNNQQDKAISLYESVTDDVKLIKDSISLIAIHCQIGEFISSMLNNYSLAIDYFSKAESLVNKNKPLNIYCKIYNNLACNYQKLGIDSAVNHYFTLSNAVAIETSCPHFKREALNNKALLFKEKGRFNEALNTWLELITNHCPCCPDISFHTPLIEIADIYLMKQQNDSAMNYYQKSLILANTYNALKEQAISNLKIGNYYRFTKKTDKCDKYYQLALKQVNESGNLPLIKSVSDTVSHFYFAKKQYELAYKTKENSALIADSISMLRQSQELAKLGDKLSVNIVKNEMEKEIAFSDSRVKQQKAYMNYLLLVIIIIIGIGFFYFRRYAIKNEQLIILRKHKDEFILKNIELLHQYRETKIALDKLVVQKIKIENIHFQSNNVDETIDAKPDLLILQKCIEIINQNIENSSFSVDILAKELNLSKSNLYRKIKNITDYNPAELIRNMRMKHAAELLKKTELRVYEVAFASGYEDAVKFSQVFKKAYGKLPSEYAINYESVA